MAQETTEHKLIKRVRADLDNVASHDLMLAKIADNATAHATLNKFKEEPNLAAGFTAGSVMFPSQIPLEQQADGKEKMRLPVNTKQFRIMILGQHDESVPSEQLPKAWPPFTDSPNPMWDTGKSWLPVGTWVYVYKDPISNEYFIVKVSPNSVCELDPIKHGFRPQDSNYLLVPDNMYRKQHTSKDGVTIPTMIPPCASVTDYQVHAEVDDKQFNIKDNALVFSTYCRTKSSTDTGSQIGGSIEQGKKISEQLDEQFKFLEEWKTGIDDAIDDIEGDIEDTTSFWKALRTNDVTLTSFNNTISQYVVNMGKMAQNISNWLVGLFTKLKNKTVTEASWAANKLKGLFPPSSRYITSEWWSEFIRILSCIWNALIRLLPGFVDRALNAFFKKIVNSVNCLMEDFLSGFIGQLLGQIAALITGVFNNIINSLTTISSAIGGTIDLIEDIGTTLDSLFKLLKCEFDCVSTEGTNVIRYDILDGAKPDNPIDFGKVWEKAKKVARKWEGVTNIPEDVENYQWEFDVEELLRDMFDESFCDSGPVFCEAPHPTFWGVLGISTALGNIVVAPDTGELIGVDITDAGEYNNAPLISIDDNCGNGKGGTGEVFIGPVTGIGTVGVATTGPSMDLDDDYPYPYPTYPGDGGQGTTAGIGITYHVTVNNVAVGDRFFINDKQQMTLTFERGNTYILNQEHFSNNGHPLRFSETKDGAWTAGGKEYTQGVTIDGIPGLGQSTTDTAYSRMVVDKNTPKKLYYYCENHKKMGGVINVTTPETIIINDGNNATVEVAAVNTRGGVIALKNLNGGSGYNECMANVPTKGGNGTGLTLEIVKTNGGSIEALSINNKGSNYQLGDIVTITARVAQILIRPAKTKIGVTKVLITNSGYGYLSAPDGSMGGMNRSWAGRCQTIVRRKNLDWDAPYSPGEFINLYTGDWVQLPGKPKVYIDEFFDEGQLLGAQVTGVTSYVPQDMTDFPISSKREIKPIDLGISSTSTIIPSFAPDGKYDWDGNGPTGVARTDGQSPDITREGAIADWNFYLEGEYLGEFKQNSLSEIPQIEQSVNEREKIVYRVGSKREFTPSNPFDDQIPWVRTADVLRPTNWVLTSYDGWSQFLKTYGVYPSVEDVEKYKIIGTSSAVWRVATYLSGSYIFNVQADNVGTLEWRKYTGGTGGYGTGIESATVVFTGYSISPVNRVRLDVATGLYTFTYLTSDRGTAFASWYIDGNTKYEIGSLVVESDRSQIYEIIVSNLVTNQSSGDGDGGGGEDWTLLGSTQPYAGHNRMLQFQFSVGDVEPAIYEIRASIENKIHRDGLHGARTYVFETNPAAIAWTLQDPYGQIIKTSLDEYGIPNVADVLYGYSSTYSIKAYNVSIIGGTIPGIWFDCESDYKTARLLGFTDCDIRAYLEGHPEISLDACMRAKLEDENWGKCDGDLMVSLTAPGCPPPPCLPNNTYPVIVSLDEIYIENTGFGFDCCKDTVKIEPPNGAKAKIEECENGEIKRIVVIDGGAGFTSLPTISINTETGFNAILKPIMKFSKPEEIDTPEGTNVIQVVDCVGKVV